MGKPRGRNFSKKQNNEEEVPRAVTGFSDNANVQSENSILSADQPNTFFGVLDTQELEYFKQAESTLTVDTFETPEEKVQFVTSVIEESKNKELKLATSQICSKLMERLILVGTNQQLKAIFQSFNGFFFNMACHKYSSHVLETLLVRGAAVVEKELLTPQFEGAGFSEGDDEVFASMETLFLHMMNEITPNVRTMLNHRYASHVLRMLILILSSKTLPSTTMSNSALRSKRSKIARKMIDIKDNEDFNKTYKTPDSFKVQLREMLSSLYRSLTGGAELGSSNFKNISMTHITKTRELCIDAIASPVLQLIIQVEGIFDRDRSFWHLIFSSSEEKNAKEEALVEYLLSDPVGSHFLENVISFTRVKYTERLYKMYMKDRIVKLSKRDLTGAFVVQALLKHLRPNDVKSILNDIVPELSVIVNSNMDFCTSIIEASIQQGDYMKETVLKQLIKRFYPEESEDKNILESCLMLTSSTLGNTRDDWPTAEERRRSLFLEKLIDYDDKFLEITIESLLAMPQHRVLQMCYHGVFSHVVEHVLQVKRVDKIQRKRLLNIFCTDVVNLSCNAYGSHLIDKLWEFTTLLPMYKERIATSMTGEAEKVKNSVYGRQAWKNWSLDTFMRKRFDWKRLVKEQQLELFPDAQNTPQTSKPFKRKPEFSSQQSDKRPRR
ncbi:LANO_0H09208g1_1 [Lachancea nothofagi CBS 11611]|uniref:Nucleolar protein 9 n=1 Tax=Lachancea nothofagi CBS 11611 TaxID=1266666 RepID=A0A1G4KLR9_9SACH|nr:LANO_0H09208g1_1 [Lachancea nothofagi CBS 11611]